MDAEQTRRLPKFRFRVLVVGRANAGKTSILQRVCETTESPTIYREGEEVKLEPSMNRGEHKIDDELVFSNCPGYIFHDSMGIESGSIDEVEILKDFIQRKCAEKRLRDKLHAIWYCVPMDGHRPGLDLKYHDKICADPNVPLIVVFTKYDQFLRNVKMDVSDYPDNYPDSDSDVSAEVAEKRFQDHYLCPLGNDAKYVRLAKMHVKDSRCDGLVEETAAALNEDTVALMLLAVQRGNIELSVKTSLSRVHRLTGFEVEQVIRACLAPFPYLWASVYKLLWTFLKKMNLRDDDFFFFDFSLNNGQVSLHYKMRNVKSLPAIKNLILDGPSHHHLIIVIILVLKHAMFLRASNSAQLALSQAEQNYQGGNIHSKIQEYLKAFSPEDSVEQFAGFIMATDMVPSQSSIDIGE
ncbi:hypothetical protein EI94DRAFT_1737693 [Lactarius quietus]|nr:hypothetical protein EI94DRAFT_1737693 [Lactarius quietus]